MKEFEVWLKSIATGLKTMAEGIQTIANMVDDMAKSQSQDKPKKAQPASKGKPKPASRKKARSASINSTKKVKPKGRMPLPATEKVLRAIKQSKKEVDNTIIANKTGLDRKQVANALSQLKKTGKVKSVKRGVHKAI